MMTTLPNAGYVAIGNANTGEGRRAKKRNNVVFTLVSDNPQSKTLFPVILLMTICN